MKCNNVIRDSLNENLSGLYISRQRHAELMNDIVGGKKVKKKLSLGLVLALALILAATVALAVTCWKNIANDVAAMESEHGFYETWATEDKVALIRLLSESAVLPPDDAVNRVLNGELPEAERGALADKVMTEWTSGSIDTVTLESVLEKLHGTMDTWTMEEKVWYNQMLADNGLLTREATSYALPREGDASQEEAVWAAMETFHAAFGVSVETLGHGRVEATFECMDADVSDDYYVDYKKGDFIWSVIVHAEPRGEDDPPYGLYHADLTNTGSVIAYTAVGVSEHSQPIRYLVPRQDDMTRDAAVNKAKKALRDTYALTEDDLTRYAVDAYFWRFDRMPEEGSAYAWNDRLWTVLFGGGDEPAYRVDIRDEGQIVAVQRFQAETGM